MWKNLLNRLGLKNSKNNLESSDMGFANMRKKQHELYKERNYSKIVEIWGKDYEPSTDRVYSPFGRRRFKSCNPF